MHRVEHIDLEIESIAHMITIEWDSLHQGDMRHKCCLAIVHIPAVADCQSMINGEMKPPNMFIDCQSIRM